MKEEENVISLTLTDTGTGVVALSIHGLEATNRCVLSMVHVLK